MSEEAQKRRAGELRGAVEKMKQPGAPPLSGSMNEFVQRRMAELDAPKRKKASGGKKPARG